MINNDFAFNTIGLFLNNTATSRRSRPTSPATSSGRTTTRPTPATATRSSPTNPNKVTLQNNLFYGNGASDTDADQRHQRPGQRVQPGRAGHDSRGCQSNQGNFVGNPAFVFPIDPRPGSDGPANFFIDADFQLTVAFGGDRQRLGSHGDPDRLPGQLPGQDHRRGFGLPGYGPRDIGAFEFDGTGGDAVGGCVPGRHHLARPGRRRTYGQRQHRCVTATSPTAITVTFSGNVNPSSISATDLVLSGSAVNPAAPSTPPA